MSLKKKSLILSIIFIIFIQILLLINNKQKTSIRYFIWNIQDVSIGRLVIISFISGLFISNILNITLPNNNNSYAKNEDNDYKTSEEDYSLNKEDFNESNEIPPERDLRDTQPTISVNYRVIKNNGDDELGNRNQTTIKTQSEDDWDNDQSEW